MPSALRSAVLLLVSLSATLSLAADPAPETLYTVTSAATPATLKAGEKGTFVVSIQSKAGAHVSQEAPLKLELKGTHLTPAKTKLAMADSVVKPPAGESYADPKFEVPFTADSAGQGSLEAKLTFFICTDTICARQQKTLSAAVKVQ